MHVSAALCTWVNTTQYEDEDVFNTDNKNKSKSLAELKASLKKTHLQETCHLPGPNLSEPAGLQSESH